MNHDDRAHNESQCTIVTADVWRCTHLEVAYAGEGNAVVPVEGVIIVPDGRKGVGRADRWVTT